MHCFYWCKKRFLNLEVALFFFLLQKSCFNFRKYYYTHIVKPMCAKYNVSNNIWMQQIQGIQLQRDELLKRWSYFHSCLLWKHEIGALYKRKSKNESSAERRERVEKERKKKEKNWLVMEYIRDYFFKRKSKINIFQIIFGFLPI